MKRLLRILKRTALGLGIVAVLVLLAKPAMHAYEWIAWNVLTKDFQAVCTYPFELTNQYLDDYRVVEGPYTAEFWRYLREAYTELGEDLEPEWALWQEDGSLRVPVGFDLEPEEKDRMTYLHDDRRPRERSHVLASYATNQIYKDRIRGRVDLTEYEHLKYSFFPETAPPATQPDTCGFMEEVITVGGRLSSDDAATIH